MNSKRVSTVKDTNVLCNKGMTQTTTFTYSEIGGRANPYPALLRPVADDESVSRPEVVDPSRLELIQVITTHVPDSRSKARRRRSTNSSLTGHRISGTTKRWYRTAMVYRFSLTTDVSDDRSKARRPRSTNVSLIGSKASGTIECGGANYNVIPICTSLRD